MKGGVANLQNVGGKFVETQNLEIMNNLEFRIGVLCSGNTCRSPVLSAWIKHFLGEDDTVKVWTAGMNMNDSEVGLKVYEQAIQAVREMNLQDDLVNELIEHTSRKVEFVSEPANLIIWITEVEILNALKKDTEVKRIDFIKNILRDKNANLIILHEKDKAWETLNWKTLGMPQKTENEIYDAYLTQSEKLKYWAEIIYKEAIINKPATNIGFAILGL